MSSSELRVEYYNQEVVDKESLFLRWFLSDGAGALLLSSNENNSIGLEVETTYIESIGGKRKSLMFNHRPALWLNPLEEYAAGAHHLRQNFAGALASGQFQEADGSIFVNGFSRMMAESSIDLGDIRYFQINLPTKHIVDSIKEEFNDLGLSPDVFYSKLDQLGYCGPPMVFICLDAIIRQEELSKGQCVASFVTEVSKFMQAGYILRHHDISR